MAQTRWRFVFHPTFHRQCQRFAKYGDFHMIFLPLRLLSVPPTLLSHHLCWKPPRYRISWLASQPPAFILSSRFECLTGNLASFCPPTAAQFYVDAVVKNLFLHGRKLKIGWGKPSRSLARSLWHFRRATPTRNVYLGG